MKSLKELYKIGNGPSSSHTMGPQKAALMFREKAKEKYGEDIRYRSELYGSLAATGRGHLTDYIVQKTLSEDSKFDVKVDFVPQITYKWHTNAMKIFLYKKDDENYSNPIMTSLYFSIGGGAISEVDPDISYDEMDIKTENETKEVYNEKNYNEIYNYCESKNIDLVSYVIENEEDDIREYLLKIWKVMENCVNEGLEKEGYLPGLLKLTRKASKFLEKHEAMKIKDPKILIYAYALAASEENAAAGLVVTAPTCGASGIIPALLYFYKKEHNITDDEIVNALAVAGVIGNIFKQNASISGAEVGCQGEVGVACSMGAAMISYLMGGNLKDIEYAAEIGMEHSLGMTCDPIYGYVQVPCIERNAIYSVKALDCATYSMVSEGEHIITLDEVVHTMLETGKDLCYRYKETSLAGLAKLRDEEK